MSLGILLNFVELRIMFSFSSKYFHTPKLKHCLHGQFCTKFSPGGEHRSGSGTKLLRELLRKIMHVIVNNPLSTFHKLHCPPPTLVSGDQHV